MRRFVHYTLIPNYGIPITVYFGTLASCSHQCVKVRKVVFELFCSSVSISSTYNLSGVPAPDALQAAMTPEHTSADSVRMHRSVRLAALLNVSQYTPLFAYTAYVRMSAGLCRSITPSIRVMYALSDYEFTMASLPREQLQRTRTTYDILVFRKRTRSVQSVLDDWGVSTASTCGGVASV